MGTAARPERHPAQPSVPQRQASARNLKRLRAIAAMVCDLDLAPQDAALLMHAGIATRLRWQGQP